MGNANALSKGLKAKCGMILFFLCLSRPGSAACGYTTLRTSRSHIRAAMPVEGTLVKKVILDTSNTTLHSCTCYCASFWGCVRAGAISEPVSTHQQEGIFCIWWLALSACSPWGSSACRCRKSPEQSQYGYYGIKLAARTLTV